MLIIHLETCRNLHFPLASYFHQPSRRFIIVQMNRFYLATLGFPSELEFTFAHPERHPLMSDAQPSFMFQLQSCNSKVGFEPLTITKSVNNFPIRLFESIFALMTTGRDWKMAKAIRIPAKRGTKKFGNDSVCVTKLLFVYSFSTWVSFFFFLFTFSLTIRLAITSSCTNCVQDYFWRG